MANNSKNVEDHKTKASLLADIQFYQDLINHHKEGSRSLDVQPNNVEPNIRDNVYQQFDISNPSLNVKYKTNKPMIMKDKFIRPENTYKHIYGRKKQVLKTSFSSQDEWMKSTPKSSNPYKYVSKNFIQPNNENIVTKSALSSKDSVLQTAVSATNDSSAVLPKEKSSSPCSHKGMIQHNNSLSAATVDTINDMKTIIKKIEVLNKKIKTKEESLTSGNNNEVTLKHSANRGDKNLRTQHILFNEKETQNSLAQTTSLFSIQTHEPSVLNPDIKNSGFPSGTQTPEATVLKANTKNSSFFSPKAIHKMGQKLMSHAVHTIRNKTQNPNRKISRYSIVKFVSENKRKVQHQSSNKYKVVNPHFSLHKPKPTGKKSLINHSGKNKLVALSKYKCKRKVAIASGYSGTSVLGYRRYTKKLSPYDKFRNSTHLFTRRSSGICNKYKICKKTPIKSARSTSRYSLHNNRTSSNHFSVRRELQNHLSESNYSHSLKNVPFKSSSKCCWYYSRFGKCSRSNNCPFIHMTIGKEVSFSKSIKADSYGNKIKSKYKIEGKGKGQLSKPATKYCLYFNRFGKCNRGTDCTYIHDPNKVAVCTRFLRGTCQVYNCPFSHKVSKEKMPVCKFFLKGQCHKHNCYYAHVNVGENAEVCKEFVSGYCTKGDQCKKKHVLQCPEFEKNGKCVKGNQCKMLHTATKQKPKEDSSRLKTSDIQPQLTLQGPPKHQGHQLKYDEDDVNLPLKDRILPAFISINTSYSSSVGGSEQASIKTNNKKDKHEDNKIPTFLSNNPSHPEMTQVEPTDSKLPAFICIEMAHDTNQQESSSQLKPKDDKLSVQIRPNLNLKEATESLDIL